MPYDWKFLGKCYRNSFDAAKMTFHISLPEEMFLKEDDRVNNLSYCAKMVLRSNDLTVNYALLAKPFAVLQLAVVNYIKDFAFCQEFYIVIYL